MDLQNAQDSFETRIKFAITSETDITQYVSASNNYKAVWKAMPKEWVTIQLGSVIPSGARGGHPARLFSTAHGDMLAVEHETGLEIFLAVLATTQTAVLLYEAYQRWRANRQQKSTPSKASSRRVRNEITPTIGNDSFEIKRRHTMENGVVKITITSVPAHLLTMELVADLLAK